MSRFFISSLAYEPGFPMTWEGLDAQSAIDATPVWYGVSSGNGNDGVSHMWPDYFVRCADPFLLAHCAMISQFEPDYRKWALENCEIDGEAEYGICATIYNPPDDESDRDHSECEDGEDCEGCERCEPDADNDYCSVNGAWMIIEIFRDNPEEFSSRCMRYDNLDEAISADVIALCGTD